MCGQIKIVGAIKVTNLTQSFFGPMAECTACGSKEIVNLGKPRLQFANTIHYVLECSKCGLQWSAPMPTTADLDAYYHAYYQRKKANSFTGARDAMVRRALTALGWYAFRNRGFIDLINQYSSRGVLLDYGCGEGALLRAARKDGWKVIGVDYSSENTERLRADGFDVRCASDLRSSGIPASSIDCLVMKHVIEHVVDLGQLLVGCRSVLKPKGIMAIKTPSRTSNRARLGLANWHLVNPPEHQWGFLPLCFRLLMESHGFEVICLWNSCFVDELISIIRVRQV